MPSALESVRELLRSRLAQDRDAWLETTLARPALPEDQLGVAFATAGRKLGIAPIALTTDEARRFDDASIGWIASGATTDELARVLILARAVALAGRAAPALVAECYRQGDAREKRAVLRALAILPEPSRFDETAVNACRTSVQTVFEALACENPYPADHFSQSSFNQMVLKCLFVGVPLERMMGLERRRNAELSRMAADYASERRAAGRSVPSDIDRYLG